MRPNEWEPTPPPPRRDWWPMLAIVLPFLFLAVLDVLGL